MSAGDIWYSALSGLGNDIAQTIHDYRKRKENQDMVAGELEMFRSMPNPATGKPMLDDKSYEAMSNFMQRHKDVGAAIVQERMQFLQALAITGAQSKVRADEFTRREFLKERLHEHGATVRERLGEQRDRAKAGAASGKADTQFADVFINPIKEELGTSEDMKNFTGANIDINNPPKNAAARVYDRHGNMRIMPIEVYKRGKQTANEVASQSKLKPGKTPSEKAMSIKQMYKDGKMTQEAAIRALKGLGEGYGD